MPLLLHWREGKPFDKLRTSRLSHELCYLGNPTRRGGQMRAYVLLIVAAASTSGCLPVSPAGLLQERSSKSLLPTPALSTTAARSAGVVLNPASSSDRAMIAFGTQQKSCNLWSNWQKTCSRLNGRLFCQADRQRQVKPSIPFCASGELAAPESQPQDQLKSMERFCTARGSLYGSNALGTRVIGNFCRRWDEQRPFNGKRIATLVHPQCAAWADSVTKVTICQSGPRNGSGARSCEQLASAGYQHPNVLFCSAWREPPKCVDAITSYNQERDQGAQRPLGIPNSGPIHGMYCPETNISLGRTDVGGIE